ncbi:hypothetical protein BX600DRAFT_470327 [Xylariales sp. PMI_506]|nr:hypothetical protein BX600DRAFT_470327 [Xylariales sp. PMI_506]
MQFTKVTIALFVTSIAAAPTANAGVAVEKRECPYVDFTSCLVSLEDSCFLLCDDENPSEEFSCSSECPGTASASCISEGC